MLNIKTGATLSGGTTVALSPAGVQPGKSVYLAPDNSRLQPRKIEFTSTTGGGDSSNLGTARSGMKITFADRKVSEGCCTVKQGSIIFDFGVRWDLSQSEDDAEEVLEYLRGLVFTQEFHDLILNGVVPTA